MYNCQSKPSSNSVFAILFRAAHLIFLAFLLSECKQRPLEKLPDIEWQEYLGGPDRNHYSPLNQINKSNLNDLQVAWIYHARDSGQMQFNPIVVNGVLYGISAKLNPFALEASSGKEIWKFSADSTNQTNISRGVAYWEDGNDKRIFFTKNEYLIALSAETGEPITTFGLNGRVSLKSSLGSTAQKKMVISTTPGTIFKDKIIMPIRVSEADDAALGNIQAFNVKTGDLEWYFSTIPNPGSVGYDTWPVNAYKNKDVGAANNWAGMAIDRERGIVFVPTGSSAPDYYGGSRAGSNLFANTLLALDAQTGKRIWHYQMVHHDILDRDLPAPPNLVRVFHNNRSIDAVAQVTKHGYLFLFDRENGNPLFPIEERPVPKSDVPGENAWPTQPIPIKPKPFTRQFFDSNDISPYARNKDELLNIIQKTRYEGPFTPLTRRGSFVFPGLDGGAEWGGAAVDTDGIMYINSNEMVWRLGLGPKFTSELMKDLSIGHQIYSVNCSTCHGLDLSGSPSSGYPSLRNIHSKFSTLTLKEIIVNGKGKMPAFNHLTDFKIDSLIGFLINNPIGKIQNLNLSKKNLDPYPLFFQINLFEKFLDDRGFPAVSPPWGTLNAIDLNTGEYKWRIPFGTYPELIEEGYPITGAESYGGPVVTSSGLVFIAGTKDKKFRAFDKENGELLWETTLPAAGFATPCTYSVNGKQFIVIACGGGKLGAEIGDAIVAFSLPN